ncbi:MAG: phosphatidate cytidylyltransferase [Bacteroidales bacterium]|nr:phosphatidate cytidylyltransferase [Bacteroidales bacterium]
MNPKTKNLLIRTASGAVYAGLMIAGTLIPPLMVLLMCIVSIVGIHEFCKMTSGPVDRLSEGLMMIAAFFLAVVALCQLPMYASDFAVPAIVMIAFFFLLLGYVAIMVVAELFRRRPCPIEQIGKGVFGMLWIVLPLGLMATFPTVSRPLALAFLLLIWGCDTFAYLGGSMYGKHKMFERISPKKTWEGTLTGIALTMAMAVILWRIPFFKFGNLLYENIVLWIIFALVIALFGIFGDLLESLFKRNAGIKDSGNIMPGHGGILDRFDSILFAITPVMLLLIFLFCIGY